MTQQQLQEQRSKHTAKRCDITFSPRCQNGADFCTYRESSRLNFTGSFRKAAVFLITRVILKLFINVGVKKIDRSNSRGKCDILKYTPSLQALCVVLMDEMQP